MARSYRRWRELLSIVLGVQPAAETQAVYEALARSCGGSICRPLRTSAYLRTIEKQNMIWMKRSAAESASAYRILVHDLDPLRLPSA